MVDFKRYFNKKKITVMGLGILGRGLGYTKFLAQCGADLIVTDLKPSTMLRSSLHKLWTFKNIKFVLGEHRLEDFSGRDMIIKNPGVPLDSIYIKEAKKNNIPVEMDVSLFAKLAPEILIVGVTGTRGKSMTTALIYEILKANAKFLKYPSTALGTKKPAVFLGGNVRGVATLPLLKKVKSGDVLVCELDSWQLQGFDEAKLSPHISVFTSFMSDHMNYYGSTSSPQVGSTILTTNQAMKRYFDDKANIFRYQKENDILIIRPDVEKLIPKNIESKLIIANAKDVKKYKFIVPGEHQRENLACAVEVAKQFNIPESKIIQTVKNFKGLEGRLQYMKMVKGVKIYNDNNATTPEATIAGIEALRQDFKGKNIVLICGGADKNLPLDNFIKIVNKYCKVVVLIPGTGTEKLKAISYKLQTTMIETKSLNNAIKIALKNSQKNDIILFSPAFASFGMFNNEYERNDLFVKIVKGLK
jgi:UDP-N-acetylmuramoylalanine--D-glutamate ligase